MHDTPRCKAAKQSAWHAACTWASRDWSKQYPPLASVMCASALQITALLLLLLSFEEEEEEEKAEAEATI
jgi:hypothetical protein